MTKFVCDFDAVRDTCQKMDNAAERLESELNSIKSSVDTVNSSWQGQANSNFDANINSQTKIISGNIRELKNMSTFLKQTADSIENLEKELSAQEI